MMEFNEEMNLSIPDAEIVADTISHIKCPHSNTIQTLKVVQKISQQGLFTQCVECGKSTTANDENGTMNLWLCCYCGSQLCGRYDYQHAMHHYKTESMDHAICINTGTKMAYCYGCDNDYKYTSDSEVGKIANAIADQQNLAKSNDASVGNIQVKISTVLNISDDTTSTIALMKSCNSNSSSNNSNNLSKSIGTSNPSMIRGLRNLGNTCFFNAVLQCLVQTPYLVDVLKQSSKAGEEFTLQGGTNNGIVAPPFTAKLKGWKTLTSTLAETLEELQKTGSSYDPRKLFDTFVKNQPQFAGGDQHDSHELLRHLLDAVRNDDLKRYKLQVLKFLNYDEAKVAESERPEFSAKCKMYGAQINDRILIPEHVFRGFLVSTLTCQDCYHKSPRHESFLDISLPVNINRSAPLNRKHNSQSPPPEITSRKDRKGKHEKKLARKAARSKKAQKLAKEEDDDDQVQHTAAYFMKSTSKRRSSSSSSDRSSSEPKTSDNKSPTTVLSDVAASYDTNGNKEEPSCSTTMDNVNGEINGMCSPTDTHSSNNTDENNEDTTTENTEKQTIIPSASQNELLSMTISDEGKALLIDNRRNGGRYSMQKSNRIRTKSFTDCSTTIAPPYVAEENECSIQSCLQNFTEVENLNGNNKVGCELCAETFKCKTYYTVQTKQLLISTPPAVMILHLKRFQLGMRGTFHKLSDRITFPLILDMASFCSSTAKLVPNVKKHQKKIVYSLYGVVEHSGGMHGGHYIAYVKVRPQISRDDPRWKFIPQNSNEKQIDEQKSRLDANLEKERAREKALEMRQNLDEDSDDTMSLSSSSDEAESMDEPSEENLKPLPGKWYYASDSSVSEVDEKRVLNAQAYLLFYERIY